MLLKFRSLLQCEVKFLLAGLVILVDPLARRYEEDRDYYTSQCNLREAVLMNKDVVMNKDVGFIRCSGSLIFCLLKGFCHIELDLVLELLNFELGYFLARKCYCLEQSLLNLSTIIAQLEDILW